VELVSLNLECLWDPTISSMGRRRGPHRTAPSGVLTGLSSPVVVGSASNWTVLVQSRHGASVRMKKVTTIVIYEARWHYSENRVHRGSTDVAWSTTCSWLVFVNGEKSSKR
jgi:hypothetical protein